MFAFGIRVAFCMVGCGAAKMAGMAGRPTKLTPEVQERLCAAISAGNYYQAACGAAGISYSKFRDWMNRGKKQRKGLFRDFREAVLKAERDAEARVVNQWQEHMPEDWRACRDFLARRYPKRWGPKESLELKGKKGAPIEFIEIGHAGRSDSGSDS